MLHSSNVSQGIDWQMSSANVKALAHEAEPPFCVEFSLLLRRLLSDLLFVRIFTFRAYMGYGLTALTSEPQLRSFKRTYWNMEIKSAITSRNFVVCCR